MFNVRSYRFNIYVYAQVHYVKLDYYSVAKRLCVVCTIAPLWWAKNV